MSRVNEFINSEKDHYGKIFVDINYAIDNVSPFLDKEILNKRKYSTKITILKKYIELIESTESEINHGSFFNKFRGDKYISLLESYKHANLEFLNQLEKCSKCQCLNCTASCKFDSCLACKEGSNIVSCDREKINITVHDNFTLDLINNKTGRNDKYKAIAVLQDIKLDKKYIIIQNILTKEKFILYYYPGISEDTYGEITDADEFDFIVSTFQSVDN